MAYIGKLTNEGGVKSLNRYVSMLAGNTAYLRPAYESIATINVGAGGASAIDFSSIPSNYQHLQVRFLIKSSSANNDFSIGMNGSFSITNSSSYSMLSNGSAASSSSWTSQGYISPTNSGVGTGSFPSGSTGVGVIDILEYSNTNKLKTLRMLWGSDQNGAGFISLGTGLFNTTSTISTLNFFNGYNWAQYSSFSLYGIRAAE
jgi:hypothetical protein